ncbi:MAG: tetratricopeptide repeat protein [Candidatus Hodarchaeota archaeon]
MAENISRSESKELTKVKKLIDECKYDEANQLINNFEEKGGYTRHDIVLCHSLKCELLFWQNLFEDVIKLAEQTYKESLGLGKNLLSVDILLIMAHALLCLYQTDKAYDITKQGEELLKTLTPEFPAEYKQREAYIAFLKGWAYDQKSEADHAIKQFELSISLRKELGAKKEIAYSLVGLAHVFMYRKGDFYHALEYLKHGLALAEESGNKWMIGYCLLYMGGLFQLKGELDRSIELFKQSLTICNEIENCKFMIARILGSLGASYAIRGELSNSIRSYEQSLEIFKEYNSKILMAGVFDNLSENYRMKGDLDRALEYIEKSMGLSRELGALGRLAFNNDSLIQILIDKGDLERAQKSLRDLEQLNSQLKDKIVNLVYLFNKALLLKTSPRAHNRVKAEELLRQILEEEDLHIDILIKALLNLCELLLVELQITNDSEILEEIKPFISQLLDLSNKSHSFWILGETYLLQAKLALISLNLEEARRLLTQGQKIAEKYGLNQLAIKISNEHDEFLKKLKIWEKLKESKAPLTERIELSHLNEQMEGMVKKRIGKLPKLETEQPVMLIIMSKEGNILLSNPFTADAKIDTTYFSEFLSSCSTFCDQILSESFDRVKFGQHTVLITVVDSFSFCYMFQGQSYSARQKLFHFSEAIKKEPDIMKILQEASNKNSEIKVNETASLEEFIYESFLSDPQQFQMPFKAYDGDEPFIFVSYSHTDRLQVYPIIDYLNKTGKNVWYDEGIPISEDWKKSIVENLERCSAFLVFITPHIIDSEYVRKEISFALKKKKPFFSIYLKETQLPSELEFEIGNIQFMQKYLIAEREFYIKLNNMLDPVFNK